MDPTNICDLYLKSSKLKLEEGNFNQLTLILGNESCDLDSAVSSLVLAIFLSWKNQPNDQEQKEVFVPILDVDRQDYVLKTEIVYSFKKVGISENDLVFRNDYNFQELVNKSQTKVILVDHHILSENNRYLMDHVTEIIDHRPKDPKVREYKDEVSQNIQIVGSCATLIAQKCKNSIDVCCNVDIFSQLPHLADLLHSAIILDTANFSEVVNKGTPLDEEYVKYLEQFLNIPAAGTGTYRSTKLSNLTGAKSDVSSLTAAQLLRKDAKVKGPFFIPGFPILVESFLRKPNAVQSVAEALDINKCRFCVLIGLNTENVQPERDIAVYNTTNDALAKQLSQHLEAWSEPSFNLKQTTLEGVAEFFTYYKQLNLSASRKQYMPALEAFLNILKK